MKRINIKCPYCNSQAFLRPASAVHGQEYRQPGDEVYVCARYPACDSYVSAHRCTRLPMGTLANRPLRIKRMEAHEAFNRLWKSGMMSRTAAYRWLQVQMGLSRAEYLCGVTIPRKSTNERREFHEIRFYPDQ